MLNDVDRYKDNLPTSDTGTLEHYVLYWLHCDYQLHAGSNSCNRAGLCMIY